MIDDQFIVKILIVVFAITFLLSGSAVGMFGNSIQRFYLNKVHPILKAIFFQIIIPPIAFSIPALIFIIPLFAYYTYLMN